MRRCLGRLPRATLGGQPKLRRPGQAAAAVGAKPVVAMPRLRSKLLLPRPRLPAMLLLLRGCIHLSLP